MKGCPYSGKVKLLSSADPIIDKHQSLFLFEALINLRMDNANAGLKMYLIIYTVMNHHGF